jgi:hypothetical protein
LKIAELGRYRQAKYLRSKGWFVAGQLAIYTQETNLGINIEQMLSQVAE